MVRADQLEERARDLKEAGRHEEARIAMQEARELRAQVERRGPGGLPEQERQQLRQRRQELLRELDELRATGNEAEAASVKERILALERAAERRPGVRAERPTPERGPERPEPREMRERRLHHVEVAIENIHAAGLHEVAEKLGEELRRQPEPMDRMQRGFFPADRPRIAAEVERLHAEIRALHQGMRDLQERIEELARERR
jgi:hypothetical protein